MLGTALYVKKQTRVVSRRYTAGKKCVSSSASGTMIGPSAYGLSWKSVFVGGSTNIYNNTSASHIHTRIEAKAKRAPLGAGYLDVEKTVVGLLDVRRSVTLFTLA